MTEVVLIGFMPGDRERVGRLTQALAARGLAVDWWSEVPTKSQWLNDLRRRVGAAPAVVAVWTAASAKDRWTAVAADEALERRILVSVLFDAVELPHAFRALASVRLIGWDGHPESAEIDLLEQALTVMLGLPARRKAAGPALVPGRQSPGESGVRPVARVVAPIQLHPPAPSVRVVADEPGAPVRGLQSVRGAVAPRSALADAPLGLAFMPGVYGWAITWAVGLTAIGLYLLSNVQLTEVARVYIGNPLFSAASGAALGLGGAGFMLLALVREQTGLSPPQLGLIAGGWGLGGGAGLLVAAAFSLPVMGVAEGVVGFDFGWVLCWLIAGAVGNLCTWLALRGQDPFLDRRDLALTLGGFALGALGGWILSWLVVGLPILALNWLLATLVSEGAVRTFGTWLVQFLSLVLSGALGGAAYGVGGCLVLFGAVTRAAPVAADTRGD